MNLAIPIDLPLPPIMAESAVARVPVELWRYIIDIVLFDKRHFLPSSKDRWALRTLGHKEATRRLESVTDPLLRVCKAWEEYVSSSKVIEIDCEGGCDCCLAIQSPTLTCIRTCEKWSHIEILNPGRLKAITTLVLRWEVNLSVNDLIDFYNNLQQISQLNSLSLHLPEPEIWKTASPRAELWLALPRIILSALTILHFDGWGSSLAIILPFDLPSLLELEIYTNAPIRNIDDSFPHVVSRFSAVEVLSLDFETTCTLPNTFETMENLKILRCNVPKVHLPAGDFRFPPSLHLIHHISYVNAQLWDTPIVDLVSHQRERLGRVQIKAFQLYKPWRSIPTQNTGGYHVGPLHRWAQGLSEIAEMFTNAGVGLIDEDGVRWEDDTGSRPTLPPESVHTEIHAAENTAPDLPLAA